MGALHEAIGQAGRAAAAVDGQAQRAAALRLIHSAMSSYQRADGKKLHDPLAMAVAIDESVCTLAEVSVFRHKTGWGSRLEEGSGTWISVDYDDAAFRAALL